MNSLSEVDGAFHCAARREVTWRLPATRDHHVELGITVVHPPLVAGLLFLAPRAWFGKAEQPGQAHACPLPDGGFLACNRVRVPDRGRRVSIDGCTLLAHVGTELVPLGVEALRILRVSGRGQPGKAGDQLGVPLDEPGGIAR